jgi:hypothetical protein
LVETLEVAPLDSLSWWVEPTTRGLEKGSIHPEYLTVGAMGASVIPREPGHPFEDYLRSWTPQYQAILDRDLLDMPEVTILAENRAGDPIAVEIETWKGAVILVPPPTSEAAENIFGLAVRDVVTSRLAVQRDWMLAEERALIGRREEILRQMREERAGIERELKTVGETKAQILAEVHVNRAIGYYKKATKGTPTPKKSIPPIWEMLEMLRGHYNKGYSGLAQLLQISKDDLEFVNHLANDKELDIRYAGPGRPHRVTEPQLLRILATGKAIVQGFIQHEYKVASGVSVAPNGKSHGAPVSAGT